MMQPHRHSLSYTQISGNTLDVAGVCLNRIGMKRRTVWDRHRLDEYFEALSTLDDNPWDEI